MGVDQAGHQVLARSVDLDATRVVDAITTSDVKDPAVMNDDRLIGGRTSSDHINDRNMSHHDICRGWRAARKQREQ
jgi:hypothetical protein